MKNKTLIICTFVLSSLILITTVSNGQNRHDKTIAIFNKLNIVKNLKTNYEFKLLPLKYEVTGSDSIKLIELEGQLTEDQIIKKIINAFNEKFNNKEINDIYEFIQTSAFQKLFNSTETYKTISKQFIDIDNEIEIITKRFEEKRNKSGNDKSKLFLKELNELNNKRIKEFKPIPVDDKEDGFYATIDYTDNIEDKDIKLENNPSLTLKDILEVKKVYNSNINQWEVSIVFTKEGARKFYFLTKENIGNPIAIVISNKIVSLPIVNSTIMGGEVSISGDFTENEIEHMIKVLKEE